MDAIRERGVNMVSLEFWGRFVVGVLEEDPEDVKHLLPQRIASTAAEYRQKDQGYDIAEHESLERCVGPEEVGGLIMKTVQALLSSLKMGSPSH